MSSVLRDEGATRAARSLEGRTVSLALADGTRIDHSQVVSAARHGTRTLWLFENGTDRFVALDSVVDVWEASGCGLLI